MVWRVTDVGGIEFERIRGGIVSLTLIGVCENID